MPFNVMIQLCNITRQSKLFQRNFYLPLLKPLSPKDALRIHIITGKDVLAKALEHWIPVLEDHASRVARRRHMPKGKGKKRQRKKESMRYLTPFFDEMMDNHGRLENMIIRKPKGRGQCYTYYIPEKKCTLVLTHQFEKAIRDKDIVDIVIAQRHEKIIVKLRDGMKVVMPLCPYNGKAPFYSGEGWTRKDIEEFHHHGRETFSIAQLFEAKEAGIEEWELEMMRMANKRKKKMKGEDTRDWKEMLAATTENMDWDAFEEESKQIVQEANEPVEDNPISMQLNDLEKTCDVSEKLKAAGGDVMSLLPKMPEIPEILKIFKDHSELTEIANISGARVSLSAGTHRFVPGQMVTSEDGELFVPGQTVLNESGEKEYTPGFTVLLENEPTLIPGLVMGNDPDKSMFLPGEATITESGELQFGVNEDDIVPSLTPPVEKEVEEIELEEEQNSEEEEIEKRPPPKKKELTYERPKREFNQETMGPKHRVRGPKKLPPVVQTPIEENAADLAARRKTIVTDTKIFDLTTQTFEKDFLEQEKERVEAFKEKTGKEEAKVDKQRREIKVMVKKMRDSLPPKPKYQPLDPITKSEKLREFEKSIKKGKFFDVDYKKWLTKENNHEPFHWMDTYQYRNTFEPVGIWRHRIWKSVY